MKFVFFAQKKMQRQIHHPVFNIIRPVLFWDTDFKTINWEKQKGAVIQRVFERGNKSEKDEIMRFYGLQTVDILVRKRGREGHERFNC